MRIGKGGKDQVQFPKAAPLCPEESFFPAEFEMFELCHGGSIYWAFCRFHRETALACSTIAAGQSPSPPRLGVKDSVALSRGTHRRRAALPQCPAGNYSSGMRPAILNPLFADVTSLSGVGAKVAKLLGKALGI